MHILFSIILPFLFLPWSRIPPDVFSHIQEYVRIQMPDMEKVQAAIGGTINIDAPLNIRGSSGAFTATKFSDSANPLYFIEPAATGNSMVVAGKVGIGTTNPVGALDVKGTIRLMGATSGYVDLVAPTAAGATTFTLPSANGTRDQVLTTNDSGALSWVTLISGAVPFESCGNPFTVTHTQGAVAPVTKTVTYGTVLSSLTGSAKCWITKNLGATNQASVVTDSTEPSAGWYWQFNRAQGRQYTTSVSPAWTITAISEDLNWSSANDPCTTLLGTGWRLPTSTEWTSADANGPWATYTDTFASVLKLHAAGYLDTAAGALTSRGVGGSYWSSTQASVTNGWILSFNSSASTMASNGKAYGFTARCLQDQPTPTPTPTPTPIPWTSCGNPFTVTHTQGVVAPVTKTVTYGTVNSSLTGSAKCWITKNLGATDQATVVTDSTEPSAGWYWQFNRAQGRQYTTSVSPAWTITAISEDLNWASANDPCALLLGTGWRLPTSTEWTSADANGPWASYTDTFASVLKLHAAGYLGTAAGALTSRGVYGLYWSSTQSSVTTGWYLDFASGSSVMGSATKAYGFTARCLRD